MYTLNTTGGGTLATTLPAHGRPRGNARRRLLPLDVEGRDALLASPGYLLPDGRIPSTVGADGLDDPTAPLELRAAQGSTDLVALRVDGGLVVPHELRFLTDGPLPALGTEPWLAAPRTLEQRVVLIAPPGYRFDWKPLKASLQIADARLTISEQRSADKTAITSRLVSPGPRDGEAPALASWRSSGPRCPRPSCTRLVPGPDFGLVAFLGAVVRERPDDARLLCRPGRTARRAAALTLPVLPAPGPGSTSPAVQASSPPSTCSSRTPGPPRPLRALIARSDAGPTGVRHAGRGAARPGRGRGGRRRPVPGSPFPPTTRPSGRSRVRGPGPRGQGRSGPWSPPSATPPRPRGRHGPAG
ncbi:MAG: hypothetical protein R3F43_21970 [bacterium]